MKVKYVAGMGLFIASLLALVGPLGVVLAISPTLFGLWLKNSLRGGAQ